MAKTLALHDISVMFSLAHRGKAAPIPAVQHVSLALTNHEYVAIVGESGSGKSVLIQALAGLLPANATATGRVTIDGALVPTDQPALMRAQYLGHQLGFVPQHVLTHLTPVHTVEHQLRQAIRYTQRLGWRATRARMHEVCERVSISPSLLKRYPHELSGGQGQRLGVAIALASSPAFIIADEPTQGLDSEHVGHITALFRSLADQGIGVLSITHDIPSVAATAHRVAVMYDGLLVEMGPAAKVLGSPAHAVTRALIGALPENGLHPMHPRIVLEQPSPSAGHVHSGEVVGRPAKVADVHHAHVPVTYASVEGAAHGDGHDGAHDAVRGDGHDGAHDGAHDAGEWQVLVRPQVIQGGQNV